MGDLEGWNAPGDLSRMRISDADRHRVAEVLREAAGEGRLEFDEFDERLELTFSATPPAELPRRAACASMRPLWVTSSVHWRACLRADII
jgi:hypothetical protein